MMESTEARDTQLSPVRDHLQSTPLPLTPPGAPCRDKSCYAIKDPAAIEFLLTPPKTAAEDDKDDESPFRTKQPWNPAEPSTWPTLHLPYHNAPDCEVPSHVDEMLIHVHYKGKGAKVLQNLLYFATEEVETEEEKQAIEHMAFLCWPFNVTSDGWWKGNSGLASEEMEFWKTKKREDEVWASRAGTTYRGI